MKSTQKWGNKIAKRWETEPKYANLPAEFFNKNGIIDPNLDQVKIWDPFTVSFDNFQNGNVESVNGSAEPISTRKYENDLKGIKKVLENAGFNISGSEFDIPQRLLRDLFKKAGPGIIKDGGFDKELLAKAGIYFSVDSDGQRILTMDLKQAHGWQQGGLGYQSITSKDHNRFRQVIQFNLDQSKRNGDPTFFAGELNDFIYNNVLGNSLIQPGQSAVKNEKGEWSYQSDIIDPFTDEKAEDVFFPYLQKKGFHTAINVTEAIAENFNTKAGEAGSNQRMASGIEVTSITGNDPKKGWSYNDQDDPDFMPVYDYNLGENKYFPLYDTQRHSLPKEKGTYELDPLVIENAKVNNEPVITSTDLNDPKKVEEKVTNNPEIREKQPTITIPKIEPQPIDTTLDTGLMPSMEPVKTGGEPLPGTTPGADPNQPPVGTTGGGKDTTGGGQGPTGTVEVGPPVQSGPVITDDEPQGGPSDIPDYTGMNFSNAWDTGRRKDVVETFMWNGKKYNTKMKKKDGTDENDEEWRANLEKNREKTRGTRPQEKPITIPTIKPKPLQTTQQTGLMEPIKTNQNTRNEDGTNLGGAALTGATMGGANLAGQGAASVVKKKKQNKNIDVVKKKNKKFKDTKTGKFFIKLGQSWRERQNKLGFTTRK
jgi:hypothetical protein